MIALFRKYLLASLILYVFCIDAALALPAHKFTQYTSEDGLEEYVVQNILQDHQGLMWFATWDGLYNYDGYKFRRFEAGPNGIKPSHSRLDQLAEDRYGYLWMVSYDGVAYTFEPRLEQFQQITSESHQVKRLTLMDDGTTWLITQQQELLIAQRDSTNKEVSVRDFFASYDLMKPSRINDLKMDSQGRHWILTEEGALRYDPATDKVSIVSNLSSYEFVETNDTY